MLLQHMAWHRRSNNRREICRPLIDILDKKINSLNSDISKSNYPFVWARLYLDHANYFLKAAKFYEDKNSIGKAKERP